MSSLSKILSPRSLTSACQDSRGLGRPQACSQQSPTGEGGHTVWCNYNRGKLNSQALNINFGHLTYKTLWLSFRWYTTTAMEVSDSPFTEAAPRRQRGSSVRSWNKKAKVQKLACKCVSGSSDWCFFFKFNLILSVPYIKYCTNLVYN